MALNGWACGPPGTGPATIGRATAAPGIGPVGSSPAPESPASSSSPEDPPDEHAVPATNTPTSVMTITDSVAVPALLRRWFMRCPRFMRSPPSPGPAPPGLAACLHANSRVEFRSHRDRVATASRPSMTPRRTAPEQVPPPPAAHDGWPPGVAVTGSVLRRAPFSGNPQVGARGHRTQHRIVDAALRVFGEEGYHQCGVARITELAGCSRVSFYQYFSGKEDVFRHLAGRGARRLSASTEALGTLTPDIAGWTATRAWVARYTDVYERSRPVFRAFHAAAETDEAVAGGSARVAER